MTVLDATLFFPDGARYTYRPRYVEDFKTGSFGPNDDMFEAVTQEVYDMHDHFMAGIFTVHGNPHTITITETRL
jgi:hypothetical protein